MGSAGEFSAFGCHILSIRRSSLGSPKFDPCLGLIFGVVLDFQKRQTESWHSPQWAIYVACHSSSFDSGALGVLCFRPCVAQPAHPRPAEERYAG